MAQLISVRLQRSDASPWGFRLQGGVDFAAPLVIQKVNGGSIAERAGLQAGDAVLRVNSSEVFNLRHKEAQDVIIRAGPSFEMTIQRGSSTWKPTVTPVGPMATQNSNLAGVTPVTKTSLAANKPVSAPIGSGHNVSAKPFLNGSSDVRLVNKQYNSPVGLYSEQSIAETLSAQTEVLSTGALGVNFKKNEKTYNPVNSEVLKMVQEAENEPRDSEPESEPAAAPTSAPVNASGLRHVTAPVFSPPAPSPAGPTKPLAPGQNICADCERLIVGVFVRIKDKNLHVECFKCATCGASLKNVGYYNINNKLYCDVHAKLAARNNPPAPNLVPVTIPPGSKLPSGTISQALQSHSLPSPSPLSPSVLPAAPPSAPSTFTPGSNVFSGPRPFSNAAAPMPSMSSVSAPATNNYASTLPRAAGTTQPGRFSTLRPVNTYRGVAAAAAPIAPFGGPKPVGGAGVGVKGKQTGAVPITPRRGRGILNKSSGSGARIPLCAHCNGNIRGPFISALGKIWCPEHFVCATPQCRRPLQDLGFVEEQGLLYCETCFEQYLAPTCCQCRNKIKGDCLKAIGKHYHPECFNCFYCGKAFGNNPFFLEDAQPYCEADWNELFTTKCFACGFPVEAGDRWVEALNNNYHSQCFNCAMCKKNLEGQSFYAKGGRPFCKNHAR